MPIYKISKRGEQERRELMVYQRLRTLALVISGLLVLATVLLLLHTRHLPI